MHGFPRLKVQRLVSVTSNSSCNDLVRTTYASPFQDSPLLVQRWLHLWQLWEIQLIRVDGHTVLGCALHLPAGVLQLLPLMHPVVPTPRQPKVTSKQLKQAEQIPCQQVSRCVSRHSPVHVLPTVQN